MRKYLKKLSHWFDNNWAKLFLIICIFISLFLMSKYAYADGTDLMQGDTQDAVATFKGTGSKVAYLIEGIVAIGAYITTKRLYSLLGIFVVSIFINSVLLPKIGGAS